jgi:hypothetical protein
MTQILRPLTEVTNDGLFYDPIFNPNSVAVSPSGGGGFPFTSGGWWYTSSLPSGQVSPFGVNGQIINPWATNSNTNILVQQYHTGYKALAAPATAGGLNSKSVVYTGFPTLTDSWTTATLSIVCGYSVIDALKTDDTPPIMNLQYSLDGGTTWINITQLTWPVTTDNTGLSGGLFWEDLVEVLGPTTSISHGTSLPNGSTQPWWGISSGNQYDTTITGITPTEVANLQVRFQLSAGYVIPVGYPYSANGAPYYIGAGWQIADISIMAAGSVAPPPNSATGVTGSSGLANALTISTGPGAFGQTDSDWQVATMVGNVVTGTPIPVKIMQPNSNWATIAGTTWVNAGDGITPTSSATPIGSSNTRYRYTTTFLLPANFASANLNLAFYASDSSPLIALNGNVIGTQPDLPGGGIINAVAPATLLNVSSGFIAGTNLIEIDVKNASDWTGLDALCQVEYQLTSTVGSGGGGGAITTPVTSVPIVIVGGTQPYGISIVYDDPQTTLPNAASNAIITTSQGVSYLQVAGSLIPAGSYTVRVNVIDSNANINDIIIPVNVLNYTAFNIINESFATVPVSFPYTGSIGLVQYGGSGHITWSLLNASTTVESIMIESSVLNYTVNAYGTYHIGLVATDSLGKTASKIIALIITSDTGYKLVDGQVEILFVDESGIKTGSHQFNIGLTDSKSAVQNRTYNYLLNSTASVIAPIPSTNIGVLSILLHIISESLGTSLE